VAASGVLGNDSDIDGDALTATLVSGPSHGSVSLGANGSFSYIPAPSFAGSDSFTYRAFDGTANSNTATVSITVLDTQPPSINGSLGTSVLWPPNHDLLTVGFTFTATDNSPGAITTSVDVFSNEDDVAPAGGDQSPDAKSIAPGTLRLRAERNANGNGRGYLIRMTATDDFANTSRTCVAAVVPKSQSAADVSSVNAAAQAATSVCNATGNPPARLLHRRRRPCGRTKAVVRDRRQSRRIATPTIVALPRGLSGRSMVALFFSRVDSYQQGLCTTSPPRVASYDIDHTFSGTTCDEKNGSRRSFGS
jgi:hypothetical protein